MIQPIIPLRPVRLSQNALSTIRRLIVVVAIAILGTILVVHPSAAPRRGTGVTNPQLTSVACTSGLNIALLADVSGSIKADPYTQMTNAFGSFALAIMNNQATFHVSMSYTAFGGSASVKQPFTDNRIAVKNRILDPRDTSLSHGTDWQAGLAAAYGTFASAPAGRQSLLIIATDGNPDDLDSAVTEANSIKRSGIHILAIGIGDDIDEDNLQAITGSKVDSGINGDVILSDFDNISTDLLNLASNCGDGGGGGLGTGTDGTGTGDGGTGTGTGTGGEGSGTGGTGSGTDGTGTGDSGGGTGTTTGTVVQPTSNDVPSTNNGTQASASPTNTPNQNPSPAPAATQTTQPQPNPAPTPTAQGTQTKPPSPTPSPFYDGKQFARGSITDANSVNGVHRTSLGRWLVIALPLAVLIGIIILWGRRHQRPDNKPKPAKKP